MKKTTSTKKKKPTLTLTKKTKPTLIMTPKPGTTWRINAPKTPPSTNNYKPRVKPRTLG